MSFLEIVLLALLIASLVFAFKQYQNARYWRAAYYAKPYQRDFIGVVTSLAPVAGLAFLCFLAWKNFKLNEGENK